MCAQAVIREVNTDSCGLINTFLHKQGLFSLVLLVCVRIQPVRAPLPPEESSSSCVSLTESLLGRTPTGRPTG